MWNKFLVIFLVISLVLLIQNITAQTDSTAFKPSFHFGAQYGLSWNTVQFSPVIQQTDFLGQRVGLVFRYTSDRHLGIHIEAAYDKRGWTETRNWLATNYTREIDYAELAFFTHIGIGNRRIQPIILLGSYLSYPINETETFTTEWMAEPEERQLFYYGQKLPERLQFGLAGGLGFELVFNRFSLQIDGRYRSALGGIFATSDSTLTFSNSQGFTSQVSGIYKF